MTKKQFINLSNHASVNWDSAQRAEAEKYGRITDVPFPAVLPEAGEAEIRELAEEICSRVIAMNPEAVMCQGEYTLTYELVRKLTDAGICCLSACTKREIIEEKCADGAVTKISVFRFVQFRRYT